MKIQNMILTGFCLFSGISLAMKESKAFDAERYINELKQRIQKINTTIQELNVEKSHIEADLKKISPYGPEHILSINHLFVRKFKETLKKSIDDARQLITENPELINAVNFKGDSLLSVAVIGSGYNPNLEMIEFLFDNGAKIKDEAVGNTLIHHALRGRPSESKLEAFKLLLKHGATEKDLVSIILMVNQDYPAYWTKVFEIALENGADVNLRGITGSTVLTNAQRIKSGPYKERIIKLLEDKGAIE